MQDTSRGKTQQSRNTADKRVHSLKHQRNSLASHYFLGNARRDCGAGNETLLIRPPQFLQKPKYSAIRRDDGCLKLQVQIQGADNGVLLSKDPQAESPWKLILNLCHSQAPKLGVSHPFHL